MMQVKVLFLKRLRQVTTVFSLLLALCFYTEGVHAWTLPTVESLTSHHSEEVEEAPVVEFDAKSATHNGTQAPQYLLNRKVEALQQELQELRGKLEEQQYTIEELRKQQRELYLDLDRRLKEGGLAKLGLVPAAKELAKKPPQDVALGRFNFDMGATTQPSETEKTETLGYQKAYEFLQNNDYDSALHAFLALISEYPKGETLPNAYYWLGDIYLRQGDLDKATPAFKTVYERYPLHPKAASALLKLGIMAYTQARQQEAEKLFQKVKSQYPNTTSARLADNKLKELKNARRQINDPT